MTADVIIVGAGPAGSTAAALLARAGRRVVVLEKSKFPRDKVCGDCLNPSAWSVIDRLGLRERILAMSPTEVRKVEFQGAHGEFVDVDLAPSPNPELVIRRRDLDALLMARAVELGAEFIDDVTVTAVEAGWNLTTAKGEFSAPIVLAADGRNSTLARLTGRLPALSRERLALQTHAKGIPTGSSVRMFFHEYGYGGIAALTPSETNLCLVSGARQIDALRGYAESAFGLGPDTVWNAITPLSRANAKPLAADGLFLLGDAAAVVEPFTGEGIYYAMRSGEFAADALLNKKDLAAAERQYASDHRAMYRGRLWINMLSRVAALNPVFSSRLLPVCRMFPFLLRALTRKVAEVRD